MEMGSIIITFYFPEFKLDLRDGYNGAHES